MSFEYDPIALLHREMLRNVDIKSRVKANKKVNFKLADDDFFEANLDREVINEHISLGGYYIKDEQET